MDYRKKTKITVVITAVLAMVITGSALALGVGMIIKAPQPPPEIKITAGGVELFYVMGINQWDGNIYDREDGFKSIMSGTAVAELEYVKNDETITILVEGTAPDSVTLTEYILKEDGTKKYDIEGMSYDFNFGISDHTGTLTLIPNYAASLSSNSADYEPGATIRGFQLVCTWKKNECEYAFIIRSDASDTLSNDEEQNNNTNRDSISLADLRQLAAKGDELMFRDFKDYEGENVGSGRLILHLKVEGGYSFYVDNEFAGKPMDAELRSPSGHRIDIRYNDIDEFIRKYPVVPSSQIHQYLDTIISSPLVSSATGDYIKAHQAEYDAIVDMSFTALFTLSSILYDGDKGLKENIASLLIQDIVAFESDKPHSEWEDSVLQETMSLAERWLRGASE